MGNNKAFESKQSVAEFQNVFYFSLILRLGDFNTRTRKLALVNPYTKVSSSLWDNFLQPQADHTTCIGRRVEPSLPHNKPLRTVTIATGGNTAKNNIKRGHRDDETTTIIEFFIKGNRIDDTSINNFQKNLATSKGY